MKGDSYMAIKDRRKVFMDYLSEILNTLDPSGTNSKLYHEKFDKMSDNQFDSYYISHIQM